MSVLQAAAIALLYALARSALSAGLGSAVLSQPLVAGTLVGALLGDPLRGAQIGGLMNLATLGLTQLRLRLTPDIAFAGYVGVPLMMLAGLTPDSPQASALFAALAVFSTALEVSRGLFNTLVAHWADYFADEGYVEWVALLGVLPTQLWTMLTTFIAALALLLLDAPALANLALSIPSSVQFALQATQVLLAALGMALSLRWLLQGSSAAYFLLGYLLAPVLGSVSAFLFGAGVATIHAYLARRRPDAAREALVTDVLPAEPVAAYAPKRQLARADLFATFLLWMFFHDAGTNFERRQNLGVAVALTPAARALCETLEERIAFLRRHLTLFSSDWSFGAAVIGAVAALEERRANGETISDAEIVGTKSAGMLLADGLGRALLVGGSGALLVALGMQEANQGSLLGVLLFALVQSTLVVASGVGSFWLGFAQARAFGEWAREQGWLRPALFGAMRLGAWALGVLTPTFVPFVLSPEAGVRIGNVVWSPQAQVMNTLMPHGLPLLLVLAMWFLLRQRWSPVTIFGVSLVAPLALALLLALLGVA
ncbi:MAG: PTS system mannose/fructose/sorbose family transporter subunit IID [Anaerolineae bacterium]|nr:PTS system mannose/fructose/sorbose family transporter subunit IID [Anaerolineae bacterium]